MLYRFVDEQKAEGFPIERICDIAGVSTSAYYDWKQHRDGIPTIAELDERRLVKEITQIHDESDGTYGSPRVTIALGKRAWVVNHKRVERLMRIHDIVGYTPKKHRTTTIPNGGHHLPDRVGRNFTPTELDVTWCGDISYIQTWEGFLYLSFVEDLASRRILGMSMAAHMRAKLVSDALCEAVGTRGGDVAGVVFHSDRGTQAIHVVRVRRTLRISGGVPVGGSHRSLLGQCPRRIVPGHVEERTRPPADVQNPGRGSLGDPALGRSLVQPPAAPLRPRIPNTNRMGGPLPSHH
jgi:hypothetical protein